MLSVLLISCHTQLYFLCYILLASVYIRECVLYVSRIMYALCVQEKFDRAQKKKRKEIIVVEFYWAQLFFTENKSFKF